MDDEELLGKIEETLEIMEYLEQRKNETITKMFSVLEVKAPLLETLRSYSKLELDEIRKALSLQGLSTLNKQKLSSVMEEKIKEMLPDIFSRLTEREFKFIKRLIKNGGNLLYNAEIRDELLYLRTLGFIGVFTDPSGNRFIYLPEDILLIIKNICSNLEVVSSVRLNEKVNNLLKGLLFHYGVIDYRKIHKYLDKYFKEPVSEYKILKFLVENFRKEYGIEFDGTYLYHEEVFDPEEIESEQNLRPDLDFLPLTEAQVLSAAEENYSDWTPYDKTLSSFLANNFDIDGSDVEDYICELKMDFRSGVDFNEAIKELGQSFELVDMNMLRSIIALVKDVYTNTGQWALKGRSPLDTRTSNQPYQNVLQPEDSNVSSFKTGRNDPCPCGSGKKYKYCCLKRHL